MSALGCASVVGTWHRFMTLAVCMDSIPFGTGVSNAYVNLSPGPYMPMPARELSNGSTILCLSIFMDLPINMITFLRWVKLETVTRDLKMFLTTSMHLLFRERGTCSLIPQRFY